MSSLFRVILTAILNVLCNHLFKATLARNDMEFISDRFTPTISWILCAIVWGRF